jgi:glycosyltransferase involved in cell wall biosynthesis
VERRDLGGSTDVCGTSMINPEQPVFSDHPIAASRGELRAARPAVDLPPLVGVVVSASRRGAAGLPATIDSLRQQSIARWELLVAPVSRAKGSGDPTPPPPAGSVDPRVRWLPGASGTPAAARAEAVAASSAAALAFLSSGDLLEPTALEKLFLAFACSDGRQVLTPFRVEFGAANALHHDAHLSWEERIRKLEIPTRSWLMGRALYDEVGGFDRALPDPEALWDFWLKVLAAGAQLRVLPEFLHWRKTRQRAGEADERRRARFASARASAATTAVAPAAAAAPADPLPATPVAASGRHLLVLHPALVAGGAEQVLINELADLLALGWRATVLATDRTYQSRLHDFARVTPDVFVLHHLLDPEGSPRRRPPDQFRDQWLRILNYFLDSRRTDLVLISNSTLGFASLPYLKITRPSLPVVSLRHAPDWPAPPWDTDVMTDLTIAISRSTGDGLLAKGRPRERVALHYTGIDAAAWRPDPELRAAGRAALGLDHEMPLILIVSRLSWEKGPDIALRTLQRLVQQGDAFRAVWAGSGTLMQAGRQFLEQQGLSDHVRLLGDVDRAALRPMFASADIFLLTSRQEGIPLSVLEAMANGLPVVASAVGGVPEALGSEYEHLVELSADDGQTVVSFCRHLQALLRDPESRQQLGRRAVERVEAQFDRRDAGARFESLLRRAMELRAAAPPAEDPEEMARFAIAMAASESLSRSAWMELRTEAARLQGLLALASAGKAQQ